MKRRGFLLALLGAAGCGSGSRVTISRGVAGVVYVWEGDFRPLPMGSSLATPPRDRPRLGSARGLVQAAARRLELHPDTGTLPPLDNRGFVTRIDTEPVATTTSDGRGYFEVTVPPGSYRILVREGERLWLGTPQHNSFSPPVRVFADEVSTVRIDVTHSAVF